MVASEEYPGNWMVQREDNDVLLEKQDVEGRGRCTLHTDHSYRISSQWKIYANL